MTPIEALSVFVYVYPIIGLLVFFVAYFFQWERPKITSSEEVAAFIVFTAMMMVAWPLLLLNMVDEGFSDPEIGEDDE